MPVEPATVRLDQLNIPAENPRDRYSPAGRKRLKAAIERYGILVPILVRRIGDEYAVVDGFTRLAILHELGWAGDTPIPVAILEGDHSEVLVAAVVVNQDRERLTKVAEWRTLRNLMSKGMSQNAAAAALGKTKGWAAQLGRLDRLPEEIRADVHEGRIQLSHAIEIADHLDSPAVVDELVKQARRGQASTRILRRIAETAKEEGITAARRLVPRKTSLTEKSWVRVEPVDRGVRFELHLSNGDDPDEVVAKLREEMERVRPAKKRVS